MSTPSTIKKQRLKKLISQAYEDNMSVRRKIKKHEEVKIYALSDVEESNTASITSANPGNSVTSATSANKIKLKKKSVPRSNVARRKALVKSFEVKSPLLLKAIRTARSVLGSCQVPSCVRPAEFCPASSLITNIRFCGEHALQRESEAWDMVDRLVSL